VKTSLLFALIVATSVSVLAASSVGELISRADAAFARGEGFSLDSYEPDLREAISAYEQALGLIPEDEVQTRAYVLDRLAQGYFELGFAYLSTDRNAQEEAFRKGKDYALASLRLDPKFVKTEQESFRAAISGATESPPCSGTEITLVLI